MDLKSKKIKQQLIAKRRDIKNKLDLLKHGETVREKIFSPITKHLKTIEGKLVKKGNDNETSVKVNVSSVNDTDIDEESLIPYDEFEDIQTTRNESTPKLSKTEHEFTESPGVKLSIISEIKSDEENEKFNAHTSKNKSNKNVPLKLQQTFGPEINDESFRDYLSQYDTLPRSYIKAMLSDDNHLFDHKYGVRHNPDTEKFYIGDSQLIIEGNNIIVKNKVYKGTHGLYELLFKKFPKHFTQHDEQAYKDIVLKTNAHRRYYQSNKQVDGSKLDKYKKIISQFASKDGDGLLMEVTDNVLDYVYWDDPNELVERLRLLLASRQAGHSGHKNEIVSIIEELREANIIE